MDSFYWVVENFLAGMSEPSKNDVVFLQLMGIKGVVSLLEYDDTSPSITESTGFSIFEFADEDDVNRLCQAIASDDYGIAVNALTDTVEWLNELLKIPAFYAKILAKKKGISSSYRINKLVELTTKSRSESYKCLSSYQKKNIKGLNRLLIETIYPDITPRGLRIDDLYRNAGINYLYLPIYSMCSPTTEQTATFVRYVDKMKSERNPVAVHCLFGRGRTGTMLTAYLIYSGIECDKAIAAVRKENPHAIESVSQLEYLRKLNFNRIIK
jgi:hypothetical protein